MFIIWHADVISLVSRSLGIINVLVNTKTGLEQCKVWLHAETIDGVLVFRQLVLWDLC